MDPAIDILNLTSQQFIEQARQPGLARPAALELYRAVFRQGRRRADGIRQPEMPVVRREQEGRTIKYLQHLDDRLETESVILPYTSRSGRRRNTLCLSSQVGCAMGCTFCETAQMGLLRNLTAEQIIAQWFAARFELDTPIDNIVFMGMGEPMDNLDAVCQAIRIFTDANGPAIAPSRITVSTVGRIEGIKRLSTLTEEEGLGRLRLAVSINAPNDTIRSTIMPINNAEPLDELMNVLREWTDVGARRVLIEYVLIPGVNDLPEHAEELCDYLDGLPCTINLIPYNPRRDSPWPAPDAASIDRFKAQILRRGRFVTLRQTIGRSLMAACGQLGNASIRRRRVLA